MLEGFKRAVTVPDETIHKQMLRQQADRFTDRIKYVCTVAAPVPFVFQCNICGHWSPTLLRWAIFRDFPSCLFCGSGSRSRQIVHALSVELFGKSVHLGNFPRRKEIVGCGMSEWEVMAGPLAEKLSYTNTYLHQEPRLDICNIDASDEGRYDFIICSDVFEHISQPVSIAFENLRRLLKPDGFVVLSVPYLRYGTTNEHFPELYRFRLENVDGRWRLYNTTRDGRGQVFDNLIFHGGEGQTLEMRLFGESSLLEGIDHAGMTAQILRPHVWRHGIIRLAQHSLPMILRRKS
jgi:SAM-dependent methyltransferase